MKGNLQIKTDYQLIQKKKKAQNQPSVSTALLLLLCSNVDGT